jgi:hypothetical protein
MFIKHSKIKKHCYLFLLSIAILFLTNSAKAIEDSNSINGLSLKALELIKEPWNENSFGKSLPVLQDKRESIRSRQLILGKLNSNAMRLKMRERQQLLHNSITIAKDANESPILSAQATRSMASISLLMYEKGEITYDEATSEKSFLIEVASDKRQDLQLRSSAIKSIEVLKINEAIPVLESLLADVNNYDIPEIARSASISLTRLSGTKAFPYIHDVMKKTSNATVFETAAYCLGQMKTTNALVAILQYNERFPDVGAAEFTLIYMEELIYELLAKPNDPDLAFAILSTHYLWQDGQKQRYKPLLYELLITAPLSEKKSAIKRLIDEAELLPYEEKKAELGKILIRIEKQPELSDYAIEVKKRLTAKKLTSKTSDIIVPVD